MMMRTGHGHKNTRGFSETFGASAPLAHPSAAPAAQYDVNLEKCVLLKCLCGSAFAAGQAPVRSLALKISVILVIQIKVA